MDSVFQALGLQKTTPKDLKVLTAGKIEGNSGLQAALRIFTN